MKIHLKLRFKIHFKLVWRKISLKLSLSFSSQIHRLIACKYYYSKICTMSNFIQKKCKGSYTSIHAGFIKLKMSALGSYINYIYILAIPNSAHHQSFSTFTKFLRVYLWRHMSDDLTFAQFQRPNLIFFLKYRYSKWQQNQAIRQN